MSKEFETDEEAQQQACRLAAIKIIDERKLEQLVRFEEIRAEYRIPDYNPLYTNLFCEGTVYGISLALELIMSGQLNITKVSVERKGRDPGAGENMERIKMDTSDMSRDELFDDAVRIVLETKRGSVSLLQRRLNIGYARASRIIEMMAASGILGECKGCQAREVMINLEESE